MTAIKILLTAVVVLIVSTFTRLEIRLNSPTDSPKPKILYYISLVLAYVSLATIIGCLIYAIWKI